MRDVQTTSDPMLVENQAAEMIGVKPQTLAVWRSTKRYDLPYVKVGRCVRYRRSSILAFIEKNTVGAVATA